jgi:hypothetical protein
MAKKLVGSMLSNHLKTLPKFSGNQNEDAVQWLKDIIDGLNYAAFTDDQKVSIISGYLNDDARRWLLQNVSVLDSIENRLTYRLSKRQINLLLPTLAFQQPILCQK